MPTNGAHQSYREKTVPALVTKISGKSYDRSAGNGKDNGVHRHEEGESRVTDGRDQVLDEIEALLYEGQV